MEILKFQEYLKLLESTVNTFLKDKELLGEVFIERNFFCFLGVRYGSEFGDERRGGTWYEIPAYEGAKSQYETGKWYSKAIGVGGSKKYTKQFKLKNPYFFDWSGMGEGLAPLKLAEEILGKSLTNKLKKGITGINAEKSYARLEKAISDKLKPKYDGIIFYDFFEIGNRIHPKQAFIFNK